MQVITGRWVDIHKGDADKPNYRSRRVGREIKRLKHESTIDSLSQFFAAMPPLSALKLILDMAVSTYLPNLCGEMVKQRPKCIALIDVKRAHFWAYATRELYVEIPEEYGVDTATHVGKLVRSLWHPGRIQELGTGDTKGHDNMLAVQPRTQQPMLILERGPRHTCRSARGRLHSTRYTG